MLILIKDPDILIETKQEKDKILLITRDSIQEGRTPAYRFAKLIIELLKNAEGCDQSELHLRESEKMTRGER